MNPQRPEPDPAAGDAGRARLDRLEESLAFTERAVERLGGQLEDVSRGLERLLKRMESLERRVDGLAAASREVGPGEGDAERTTEPE